MFFLLLKLGLGTEALSRNGSLGWERKLCVVTQTQQRHAGHVDADPDGDHGDQVTMMMMHMGMLIRNALLFRDGCPASWNVHFSQGNNKNAAPQEWRPFGNVHYSQGNEWKFGTQAMTPFGNVHSA